MEPKHERSASQAWEASTQLNHTFFLNYSSANESI